LSRLAGFLSQKILRRSGETIQGKVLLTLYPNALATLSKNRTIVLVSGTNGKTSTTRGLAQLISQLGTTVSNKTGSNLDRGSATMLMQSSQYAVLEVDELYLPRLIAQTRPRAVLLLNLSRDQLHRMHEVQKVADRWKRAVDAAPDTLFIGDSDDPFVAFALSDAQKKIRVSFGGRRHSDGAVCPSCGIYLRWTGTNFACVCGLTNAYADENREPGPAAYRNAELANIAGTALGATPMTFDIKSFERAVEKNISGIPSSIRLVKNPASWSEALATVKGNNIILILNAREVDGIDTSWLWDVSFDELHGKKIIVCGERAHDIHYRLHVAGIENTQEKSVSAAFAHFLPTDHVEVLAAYTAFTQLVSL
jgi:UDP-N-acetylmuramyl tripeptide synthase